MISALLILAGIGIPLLAYLCLHFIKKSTSERERADYNEATAKEIQKQAGILNEHVTPDDVLKLLRKKASDQRQRETKG